MDLKQQLRISGTKNDDNALSNEEFFTSGFIVEHRNYSNRITSIHRNIKLWNSFFMVNMARGIHMDRRRVCPVTAAILHVPSHAALVYSIHLKYWTSMLRFIDTCQNKVSSDQYHMTVLRAQI